jgi:hypothetical protein
MSMANLMWHCDKEDGLELLSEQFETGAILYTTKRFENMSTYC